MIPVKHIDPDDLALYAMQLLPPEEAEEMSLHLQHSVEARRVLSEIYGDLSVFAHSAEMHSPPALARQRLMKHVAREKKAIPIDSLQAGAFAPRSAAMFDEAPSKAKPDGEGAALGGMGDRGRTPAGCGKFVQTEHSPGTDNGVQCPSDAADAAIR